MTEERKKILLITANDYLAYQPSVLNLYDHLSPFFDVTIITFEPEFIGKQKAEGRNILYLKIPKWIKWAVKKTDYLLQLLFKTLKLLLPSLSFNYLYYSRLQLRYLEMKLRRIKADIYIAVDIPVLYITQKVYGKCHFLSLEINAEDRYRSKIIVEHILCVIIQNELRYDFLFPDKKPPVFYIQNSPVFSDDMITSYERKDLIWAGSILKRFAVLDCIEFINEYKTYRLILRGGAEPKTLKFIHEQYFSLISSGNIVIDKEYMSLDNFIDYLSHYKIGFCFYSWDLIKQSFNYQSAPSGKLFMYMAAGVPVIACDIPGFRFVNEFKAGVLIKDYEPKTIYNAIKLIEEDYKNFQMGCYKAARYFSFDKNINPFIRFISS